MPAGKEDLQLGAAERRTQNAKSPVVQEGDWGRTSVTSAVLPCNNARQLKTHSHRGRGEQEVTISLKLILQYKSKSFTSREELRIMHLRSFSIM